MRWCRGIATALLAAVAQTVVAAPASAAAGSSSHLNKRYIEERDGVSYNVFEHHETGSKMSFVKNSGICETTPGVNQYSGYLEVGKNMSMWFWFFEARNKPAEAPLVTWFNGGPGCSSMIGLFQEHGPCQFYNNETEPSLNPWSWNNYANMLYVDQPIGTGFSYGDDPVNSTVTAAPYVWNLLQAFYANFPEYECRDLGIFTESYGGHYGPEFAHYIQTQNAAIDSGEVTGDKLALKAVGINNGWFDSTIQERAGIEFAVGNSYRPLINASTAAQLYEVFDARCGPALDKCVATGGDAECADADSICINEIDNPIAAITDFDTYDVRQPSQDPFPPNTYVDYLRRPEVMQKIGAKVRFEACPNAPGEGFGRTGDDARSFLDTLSAVVQTGIQVLLWAGDADYICNWMGNFHVANAVKYPASAQFNNATMKPYKVAGVAKGLFKTAGNLSFMRVYEAGHEVPYYQPEASLQVFMQVMQGNVPSST
ncbi:carboxypeptidase S1 [Apiospora phragmitis]|uniref:Carboxypeptidase n=1 Tax=Apiospora phragmitis TaxID=2905665 RepID=A0ABR1V008_9PEZI